MQNINRHILLNFYTISLFLISLTLTIGIPYAMKYFPNPDIKVYLWDIGKDAKYFEYRAKILVVGISFTFIALLLFLTSIIFTKRSKLFLLNFCIFLLTYTLGSIDYIYWALGSFGFGRDSISVNENAPFLKVFTCYVSKYWDFFISIHLFFLYIFLPITSIMCFIKMLTERKELILYLSILLINLLIIIESYNFWSAYWFYLDD
jgi:hypothetical protein